MQTGRLMSTIDVLSANDWADAIASEIVPLRVVEASSGFTGSVDRRTFDHDIRITRVRSGANVIRRSQRQITSSDDGFMFVHVNLCGEIVVEQHSRTCQLSGSSVTLYTTDKPSRFSMTEGYEGLLMQFPRTCLVAPEKDVQQSLVRPLTPTDPLVRVLVATMREAHAMPEMSSPTAQSMIPSVALQLLGGIISEQGAIDQRMAGPLLVMQQHIRENFRDPSLTVSRLGAHFGVSERLVFKLFARAGQSPASLIRSTRLDFARSILWERPGLSVHAAAATSGFADPSTFVKAFTRQYGCTPSEWRHEAGRAVAG